MQKRKKKKFAFMDIKNSEGGFTFISMLMALTIIIITLPLIIYMLSYLKTASLSEDISIHQFWIFLREDILLAEHVSTNENTLIFHLDTNEKAQISQYQNVIRRQVDGRGHEIYLRNIDSFDIESLSYGVRLNITTEAGEAYEKTIAYYE